MSTLITGATGFVGRELLKLIDGPVVITSRNRARALSKLNNDSIEVIEWDPMSGPISLELDKKITSVVNLMGESIAEGRWTDAKKKRIRESRVVGTKNLIAGISGLASKPNCFVSASAVGIYGSQGDTVIDETNDMGEGYLVDVCREWEAAANEINEIGVRVVTVRIGVVLGKGGGAMEKLVPIFRWGIGGPLGNGKHYVPWIHVSDLAKMIVWASQQDKVSGPINGVAPNPVTNKVMTKEIARAVNRPAILPAPKFGLKLMFGEFAESLFFSQRVVPSVPLANGFEFLHETIDTAIAEIV